MSASLPKQWLSRAAEDLAVARLALREGHAAHACFLSQQCIEKALKAYLLAKTGLYPRTHKLVDLLTECQRIDPAFAQFLKHCLIVDQYYIPARYPDGVPGSLPGGLPGSVEANEAILAADDILQFVTQQLL